MPIKFDKEIEIIRGAEQNTSISLTSNPSGKSMSNKTDYKL